jgi:hypothetical protein
VRRASRVDGTHRELFDAARKLGFVVVETFQVGGGCPDGFVFLPAWQLWLAVEVKTDKGKLTPAQEKLHAQASITIWRNYDDVLSSLALKGASTHGRANSR